MSQRHPKHKSLYLDEYTSKWELSKTKKRSTSCCSVAWCRNPPSCFYRRGKLYIAETCSKCRNRKSRANEPIKYAFNSLKDSAKKRSIPFSLNFDEFKEWCEQTGYASQKGTVRLTDHCDRIDDERGYEIGNIQLLSERENIQKQRNREKQTKENEPF